MDFQRSDEQQLIYRTAFDLAEAEFDAEAFTWEDEFPRTNQRILSGAGTAGDRAPGGVRRRRILGRRSVTRPGGGRSSLSRHRTRPLRSSMGPPRVIAELGSDYLKEKYLPAVCSGDQIISVAISESEAGSDASNMQTTVERDGDRLVLNGSKMWITKGEQAGAFLVYARFPDGNIGAVVVDKDTEGLSLDDGSVNMAGHVQSELYFDDCSVPEEQLLVHDKDAFKELLIEFNVERCHNAMMCIACGLNAFDKALSHAKGREQFGQPIADFQGIEWKLADMAIELEASRLLIYRAATNAIDADPSRLETSVAKVKANEVGQEVIDEALQIHGAIGYTKDSPIEYLYRWVRGWKIAGGTVEVQRNMIARDLKKYGLD